MEKEPFFGSAGWQSTEQLPPTSFFNLNWDQSMEPGCGGNQFDSTLSSLVPPPANPTGPAVESLVLRELIGRLGSICNSGDISPPAAARYVNGSAGAGASCYAAPLHSPPELNLSMMDHQHQQQLLPRTTAPTSHLPAFSADPGFAERAATLSCFGGRSYGGLSGAFVLPDAAAKMSSSQSLAAAGSENSRDVSMPDGTQFTPPMDKEFGSTVAREESPVSGPDGSLGDGNPKKRKAAPKLKGKETAEQSPKDTPKVEEEDLNAKRFKTVESTEKDSAIKPKAEQNSSVSTNGDGGQKQGKNNAKPPEPKQDYIHVRARRGQATDSHSLAERVRREKISERMKFLQDLVPGCNKVTGKAVMLDEIINYVQSLQRQVEFLSMKLATVNPRLEFNMENFLPKDAQQLHGPLPHPVYLMETAATAFSYANQPQQGTPLQSGVTNGLETQCSVNPLDANLRRNLSMQLPPLDGYGEAAYQLGNFWEDELQSVAQMGLMQNQESAFSSQTFTAHCQQLT